jgi:hypothetical protein
MKRPCEVYRKSERRYEGDETGIEYGRGFKVRQVNDRGVFHLKGNRIFAGNPFAGYEVGIKETAGKESEVWFDYIKLGQINFVTGKIDSNASIIQAGK